MHESAQRAAQRELARQDGLRRRLLHLAAAGQKQVHFAFKVIDVETERRADEDAALARVSLPLMEKLGGRVQ